MALTVAQQAQLALQLYTAMTNAGGDINDLRAATAIIGRFLGVTAERDGWNTFATANGLPQI